MYANVNEQVYFMRKLKEILGKFPLSSFNMEIHYDRFSFHIFESNFCCATNTKSFSKYV